MALTEKESNVIAGLLGFSIAALIGLNIYNTSTTMQQISNTPNNQGGNGPTLGLIPTAGGGINNAMDLRDFGIPWHGRIPVAEGALAKFENMWQSYRAGIKTIESHYNDLKQNTLNLLFAGDPSQGTNPDGSMKSPGYAPASDSNTPGAYAQTVANEMGIDPNADYGPYLTNALVLSQMLTAMAQVEQGGKFVVNPLDITMALTNLGIA